MARYLLTCNCGNQLPIDAGQAGGQVVCTCGSKLDVPTLRNLRHLPQAEAERPPATAGNWSVRKGLIAVFLIAAGLLIAASAWNWLSEPKLPVFQPESQAKMVDQELDRMTPVDAWKTWIVLYRPLAERGFSPLESRDAPAIRATIASKRFLELTLLIVAAVCVGFAALAALWPAGKPKKMK
jgi:hypothetical protein